MGVYANLVDVEPEPLEVGKTATVKVDIYNNEGSRYVTIEIRDLNTNRVIWRWQEFTQLGVTTVTKKLTVPPSIPDNPCLQAFADGKTLPEKTFEVKKIWVNGDLVWENGEQIKTAWIELEHYEDNRASYNTFEFEVEAIPLYSSKGRLEVFLDVFNCYFPAGKRYLIDDQIGEGASKLSAKVDQIGDAADLISVVKSIRYWQFFTKVLWKYTANDNWIQTVPNGGEVARTTVPSSGRYGVLFKGVYDNWVGRNVLVEVKVNGRTVGRFYTGDSSRDVMVYFTANAGDIVSIFATPSRCTGTLCPYLIVEDLQLVKENAITCTLNFTFVWHGGKTTEKTTVQINARGYYDGWFGGKPGMCDELFEQIRSEACSSSLTRSEVANIINKYKGTIAEYGCEGGNIAEIVTDLVNLYFGAISADEFRRKWCR